MTKKPWYERMHIVERTTVPDDQEEVSPEDYHEEYEDYQDEITAEAEGVGVKTIVEDAYRKNGLDDLSKSIYKVGEISSNLPNTIPNSAKRDAVVGILASFGLTVRDMDEDAGYRYGILKSVCNQMCNSEADEVKRLEGEIEELYKLAEEKKQEVQNHNSRLDAIIKASQDELKKIKGLWDFVTDKENGDVE